MILRDCCTKAICYVAFGIGFGHVREYAPFALTLSALHLILRATFSLNQSPFPIPQRPRGYALESLRRMVVSGVSLRKDFGRGPTDPSPRVGGAKPRTTGGLTVIHHHPTTPCGSDNLFQETTPAQHPGGGDDKTTTSIAPNVSTFSGIEETGCLHFQECDDIPSAYSAYGAEYIPYACGTNSVALRNPFRTHTEYEVDARNRSFVNRY